MSAADGRDQFAITIKNYGEIPASNVVATFMIRTEDMTRDILKKSSPDDCFTLGPLLPNMEKCYWFFIDSDLIQKAKNGSAQVFTALYFSYEHVTGKSGYGMISRFDAKANTFVHKEMWID